MIRRLIGWSIDVLVMLVASLVLGVVLTLLAAPLWLRFEAWTGIEAYGHGGPADWCYAIDVAALFLLMAALRAWRRRRPGQVPGAG